VQEATDGGPADRLQLRFDLPGQFHCAKAGQMLRHREQDRGEPFGTDVVQAFPHRYDHLLYFGSIAALTHLPTFRALQALGMQQPR
jgi:hypothetical protein